MSQSKKITNGPVPKQTFAQTQKLSEIQKIPIKPRKNRKKNLKQKFCPANIFRLPSDIIKLFISSYFYWITNTNTDYSIVGVEYLLVLRLVDHETLISIDDFCKRVCPEFTLSNSFMFYYKKIMSGCVQIPVSTIIYFGQDNKCYACHRNSDFLTKTGFGAYECAFECRHYYCPNRNCKEFGEIHVYDLADNRTCYLCEHKVKLHRIDIDPKMCVENSYSGEYAGNCKIYDDFPMEYTRYMRYKLAVHACGECRKTYDEDVCEYLFYDSDSDWD